VRKVTAKLFAFSRTFEAMGLLSSIRSVFNPKVPALSEEKVVTQAVLPFAPLTLNGQSKTQSERWMERMLDAFTPGSLSRSYDGAVNATIYDPSWQGYSTSGSYEVLHGWRQVCYLARDLERNNSHVGSWLREVNNNVFGSTGIRIQPRIKLVDGRRKDRSTGPLHSALNKTIKDAWTDFRRKKNFEVTGKFSGATWDELLMRRALIDGGVILRLHRNYPNKYGFAVQAIEIDALDLWANEIYGPNRITTGVETDDLAKVTGYWLIDFSQSDLMAVNTIGRRIRFPPEDILHFWFPQRITSVRGISTLAPTMIDLRMLSKYEEASAIAARNAAAKMGFYLRDPLHPGPQYEGQRTRPDGTIVEEVSPGSLFELPAGYKFQAFDPGQPNDTYPEFRKGMLRTCASGMGVMYNTLANELESINYSSARWGAEVEHEYWRRMQRYYCETVLAEIFRPWLECAILSGAVAAPFSAVEEICNSIVWRPRGWPYIDPLKDSQASLAAIDGGLSTYRRELMELGIDWEEHLDEIEEERRELEKRGLVFVNSFSRRPEVLGSLEDPSVDPGELQAQANPPPQTSVSSPKKKLFPAKPTSSNA
jgi:lambda family phage portal protein